MSVIADSDENLFVSDEANHRISSFSSEGEFLGKWGEHGDGDGQIDRPSGLAFDAEENILVVDTLNHRVQKFTKDGEFLMKWGSFGEGEGCHPPRFDSIRPPQHVHPVAPDLQAGHP